MSTTPVILLTGASRGLGLAIAKNLLEQTASQPNLVLVARTAAILTSLENQYPTRVRYVVGDLGIKTTETVKEAVSTAIEAFGKLDSVIINHGVLDPVSSLAQLDVEQARKAFDVNFFSALALVTAAIPELRKSQGRVLFVSSGAAVKGYQGWGAYGASKAAMNHLSMTLASEEPSITSIAVRPGVMDTQMQDEIREKHGASMGEGHQRFVKLKESEKLLKPEQPGSVISRLAINAGKELSGQFLDWNSEKLATYQD